MSRRVIPKVISDVEASRMLGVSSSVLRQWRRRRTGPRWFRAGRSKTYELVASGVLPSVRLGRSIRVPAQAVREFVDRLIAEQVGSNGAA